MKTREQWLQELTELMRIELFAPLNYVVPRVQVSVGFTSKGRGGAKKARVGECWDTSCADDGLHHIFVVPTYDAIYTAGTLAHELVHATVGIAEGHNKVFKKCAVGIGLEGKMTATTSGAELESKIVKWIETIGEYPHGLLKANASTKKKQTTRMVKCECELCGYTVRTSSKWLEVAVPVCPDPECINEQDERNTMAVMPPKGE